jgi:hypothetical protein
MAPPIQCRAADYVHSSGAAFVRIHDQDSTAKPELYGFGPGDEMPKEESVGFFWTSNSMLTKRWRTASTGDAEFSRKLMSDFEDFCSNKNGVLKAFWDMSRDSLVKAVEQPIEKGINENTVLDDSNVSESIDAENTKETFQEVDVKSEETIDNDT